MTATHDARSATTPILVVTTIGSRAEAQNMARALVAAGLAACVQVNEIDSVYAWQGEMREDQEYRVVVKTVEGSYAAVEAAIRKLHSHELPAIHAIALAHVHAPYGEWIAAHSNGRR
jgi:periplasmic divalent cation tolerance protein